MKQLYFDRKSGTNLKNLACKNIQALLLTGFVCQAAANVDQDKDGIVDYFELLEIYSHKLDDKTGWVGTNGSFTGTDVSGISPSAGSGVLQFNEQTAGGDLSRYHPTALKFRPGIYRFKIDVSNYDDTGFADTAAVSIRSAATGSSSGTAVQPTRIYQPEPASGETETWVVELDVAEGDTIVGEYIGFKVGVTTSGNDLNVGYDNLRIEFTADQDRDGTASHQDIDSDGDTIWDIIESGNAAATALDANSNGFLDAGEFTDSYSDGLADALESNEVLSNPEFATDLSNWTTSGTQPSSFQHSNGTVLFNGGNSTAFDGAVSQSATTVAGQHYLVRYRFGKTGTASGVGLKLEVLDGSDEIASVSANDSESDYAEPRSLVFIARGSSTEIKVSDISTASNNVDATLLYVSLIPLSDSAVDTDGDGYRDFQDLDSDNDTLLDQREGALDTDTDATPNYLDTDADGDTTSDLDETADTSVSDLDADGNQRIDSAESSSFFGAGVANAAAGDELLSNGDFSNGINGWAPAEGNNVKIEGFNGGNVAVFNWGGNSSDITLNQDIVTEAGQYYRLKYAVYVQALIENGNNLGIKSVVKSNGSTLLEHESIHPKAETETIGSKGNNTVYLIENVEVIFKATAATTTLTFEDITVGGDVVDPMLTNVSVKALGIAGSDTDGDTLEDAFDSDNADACVPSTFNSNCSTDSDGDGVSDFDEGESADADGDGKPDYQESSTADADNDGVNDQLDAANLNPCIPSATGLACDSDLDDDGILNWDEGYQIYQNAMDPGTGWTDTGGSWIDSIGSIAPTAGTHTYHINENNGGNVYLPTGLRFRPGLYRFRMDVGNYTTTDFASSAHLTIRSGTTTGAVGDEVEANVSYTAAMPQGEVYTWTLELEVKPGDSIVGEVIGIDATVSFTGQDLNVSFDNLRIDYIGDADRDGLLNHQDTDSDGDGVSDLQESANAAVAALDSNQNGSIDPAESTHPYSAGIAQAFRTELLNDPAFEGDGSAWTLAEPGTSITNGKLLFNAGVAAGATAGTASQTATTEVGQQYVLSYRLASEGSGASDYGVKMEILHGNNVVHTVDHMRTDDDYTAPFNYRFAANNASTTIRFTDLTTSGEATDVDPAVLYSSLAVVGTSVKDSDGDGFADAHDLDNDNDGLLDIIEGTADSDSDTRPDRLDEDSDADGSTDLLETASSSALALDTDSNGRLDVSESGGLHPLGVAQAFLGDELVSNGDFSDAGNTTQGWTVPGNNIGELELNSIKYFLFGAGATPSSGELAQNINTVAGQAYLLQFDVVISSDVGNGENLGFAARVKDGATIIYEQDFVDDDSNHVLGRSPWDNDVRFVARPGVVFVASGTTTTIAFEDVATNTNGGDSVISNISVRALGSVTDDSDGDGKPDYQESAVADNDGDGVVDEQDAFDTDGCKPSEFSPACEQDSDNDGVPNSQDSAPTDPCVPSDTAMACDSDGDAVPDGTERQNGTDPNNSDSDGDGIPDGEEMPGQDTDGDGIDDALDTDSDNDGISDKDEQGADPFNPVDSDEDGIPDVRDTDSDNDGIEDKSETSRDSDNDGIPNYLDEDSNNDGISDSDARNIESNSDVADLDGDGEDNIHDIDTDNDGIPNSVEVGFITADAVYAPGYVPTSAFAGMQPLDSDGDGMPDFMDLDSDNDAIFDVIEAGGIDVNKDGIIDAPELNEATLVNPADSDEDGLFDYIDADSNNDGVSDIEQTRYAALDADKNGVIDDSSDSDADGIADAIDNSAAFGSLESVDSDGDGITDEQEGTIDSDEDGVPDYLDTDSDGDGIPDAEEKGSGLMPADTDGDSAPDYIDTDSDNDGLSDELEANEDSDGNGVLDRLENAYRDSAPGSDAFGGGGATGTGGLLILLLSLFGRKQKADGGLAIASLIAIIVAVIMKAGKRVRGRRKPKRHRRKTAVTALLLSLGINVSSEAQCLWDYGGCGYVGLGVGGSYVTPEGASNGFSLDKKHDRALQAVAGWQFSERWYSEVKYADMGEARLKNISPAVDAAFPGAAVSYKATSLMLGMEWFKDLRLTPYFKAGPVLLLLSPRNGPVMIERKYSVRFGAATGLRYRFSDSGWYMGMDIDYYARDAVLAAVGFGYFFQ